MLWVRVPLLAEGSSWITSANFLRRSWVHTKHVSLYCGHARYQPGVLSYSGYVPPAMPSSKHLTAFLEVGLKEVLNRSSYRGAFGSLSFNEFSCPGGSNDSVRQVQESRILCDWIYKRRRYLGVSLEWPGKGAAGLESVRKLHSMKLMDTSGRHP